MKNRSKIRFANGIVSAVIVCFFLVHGALGSASAFGIASNTLAGLVWLGVALIVAHVCLSVATSKEQLTDTQRPPSARKKRHLALKWATGLLLAALAVLHVVGPQLLGLDPAQTRVVYSAIIVALSGVLAWHVFVGMKSLLIDLGVNRALITPLRAAVCIAAVAFAYAAVMAVVS